MTSARNERRNPSKERSKQDSPPSGRPPSQPVLVRSPDARGGSRGSAARLARPARTLAAARLRYRLSRATAVRFGIGPADHHEVFPVQSFHLEPTTPSVKIPKYQYVGFDLSLSTRRGKRRRGDWIGGSSGRTSSSDRVADRCKAAATFAGDFSVSDRAHGSCRAGADYSGLFGRPVGLRRGARDRGDAADGDTLS